MCLLIFFALIPAFSSTIEWTWTHDDGNIQAYRWQLNSEEEGGWKVEDPSTTSIKLKSTGKSDTLYVQASYDGFSWSESGKGTYIVEPVDIPLSLRLNAAPYSSAVYFFYNGHYIDKARTLMGTIYGVSTSIEFDWTPLSFLRIYPEFGYAYEMKIQTVIPKEQDMQYVKTGGGVDYLLSLSDKTDIYIGALGGVMWHINNNKYNRAPYFGSRLGLDTAITEHITIGAFTRVTASFLTVEDDTLYSSMTLLVDPVSLTLSWSF